MVIKSNQVFPCIDIIFQEIDDIKTHAYDAFCNVTLLMHQINIVGVISMPLQKGVLKDNFYESSCVFHHNLQTHHSVTP
jgi:hypothetical protein